MGQPVAQKYTDLKERRGMRVLYYRFNKYDNVLDDFEFREEMDYRRTLNPEL